MDSLDSKVSQVYREILDHQVDKEIMDLLERMEAMVWMGILDFLVLLETGVNQEKTELLEFKGFLGPPDQKETLDLPDCLDTRVLLESKGTLVYLDLKDLEDTEESLDHLEMLVYQDLSVLKVLKD